MNPQINRAQEQAVVDYIINHQAEKGYPPTVRAIAEHIGRTVSVTHRVIQRLVRNGTIGMVPGAPRTIHIKETVK